MESQIKITQSIECPVCLDMLYSPVSTQCGHNFCLPCLEEVIRNRFYHAKCPICRDILPASGYRVNHMLENLLSSMYPNEYANRSKVNNNQKLMKRRKKMRIIHAIKLLIIIGIGSGAGWWVKRSLPDIKLRVVIRMLTKLVTFFFTILCGNYAGFGQMLISNFMTAVFRSSIVW